MVAALGQKYLGFALDVLESALPDRGYMGHIKGYTLHYLLEGLSKVITEYCLRWMASISCPLWKGCKEPCSPSDDLYTPQSCSSGHLQMSVYETLTFNH